MKIFNSVEVLGRTHVVKLHKGSRGQHKGANYRDTGMALCGVTKPGETLEQWKERTQQR